MLTPTPLSDERRDAVRIVDGLSGVVTLRMHLIVRFDYGSIMPSVRRCDSVPLIDAGPDTLEQTASAWRQWSDRRSLQGRRHQPVIRSLITLKAPTYKPAGGIIAAPPWRARFG
ncbi:MAG: hypothetical protein WA807_08535 [Steroidobacteraceae bacterium]